MVSGAVGQAVRVRPSGDARETPAMVPEDWGPKWGSGDPGQRGPDSQQGSLQPLLRGHILCVRHTGPAPALGAGAPRRVSSSGSLQVL